MSIAAWHRRSPESKFTTFGKEMSIGQTPNHAKFCGNPTKSVQGISDRKFVLPKKWTKVHKFFRGCCSQSHYNQPKFCQYFGSPWGPPGPKITGLGGWCTPPVATCKILSRSDDPSFEISVAKLRWFCCWRDPQLGLAFGTVCQTMSRPHPLCRRSDAT